MCPPPQRLSLTRTTAVAFAIFDKLTQLTFGAGCRRSKNIGTPIEYLSKNSILHSESGAYVQISEKWSICQLLNAAPSTQHPQRPRPGNSTWGICPHLGVKVEHHSTLGQSGPLQKWGGCRQGCTKGIVVMWAKWIICEQLATC